MAARDRRGLAHVLVADRRSRGCYEPQAVSGFITRDPISSRNGAPLRVGVVVVNFGGPLKAEDVEPFLYNLFDDPDVIQFPSLLKPLQSTFAENIASGRAPKVVPQYEKIGFSPLVPTTMKQLDALREELARRHGEAPPFYVGMRYTPPTMAECVDQIVRDKPDRLVALALYPHYSRTTTGSSFNAFSAELKARGLDRLPVQYVPAFYDHPRYLAAMEDLIRRALAETTDPEHAHLLFSAHGLPSNYYRAGDPYLNHVQETVRLLIARMGWRGTYSLGFQSKVGPVRWLTPTTEDEIDRVALAGTREVVVVPVAFVSDHIETLYEIDVTFREFAEERNVKLLRTAALDTHPEFIGCLADVVDRALGDRSWGGLGAHRCVRCLLPKPHAHRMTVECLDCGHKTPEYLLRLPPVKLHD